MQFHFHRLNGACCHYEAFPVFLLSLIQVNEKQTWINFVSCSVRTHWGQLSQVRYAAENGNLTFIESHLTSGIYSSCPRPIHRLHVTSFRPCWRPATKDSSSASIISSSNMAATSFSFEFLGNDWQAIYTGYTFTFVGVCFQFHVLHFYSRIIVRSWWAKLGEFKIWLFV